MMRADEVIVHPHRRHLDAQRLAELQRTIRTHALGAGRSLGAAVAYRPSVGYVLIAGEHRWSAAIAPAGRERTEAIVLRTWDDLVAWMAVDITDPRRLPWDPVAAVFFYEKAVVALKPSRQDRPIEDVAEFTGVHRSILESVRWGRSVTQDPDEALDVVRYVQSLLDELERGGEGGHSVRDRVAKFKAKKAAQTRAPQSAAVQRKALESVAQLEGILAALADLGPINPEIPADEREGYANRLGSLGVLISKIKRNLRGAS